MRDLLAVTVDEQSTSLTQKATISNSIRRINKKNSEAHGAKRQEKTTATDYRQQD